MEELPQAIQDAQRVINELIEFEPSDDTNALFSLKKRVDLKLCRLADIYSVVGGAASEQVLGQFKNEHELWILLESADRCIARMHVGNMPRLATWFFFCIAVQNRETDPRESSKRLSEAFDIFDQCEVSVKNLVNASVLTWIQLATPESKLMMGSWFNFKR